MPKIRDLGINTIPVTTRPPQLMADGREGTETARHYILDCHEHTSDHTSACGEPSCVTDTSGCSGASCVPDHTSGCSGASCVPDHTSGCSGASCVPDQTSGCSGASCVPRSPRGHKTKPFSPEAIAELKQQLANYIGM